MFAASIAGRFAQAALAQGEGEVCASFRRSFYLRYPDGRHACIGDASLGRGPLNALVDDFRLAPVGARIAVSVADVWHPDTGIAPQLDLQAARPPEEGLGCLLIGEHNALAEHAFPAVEALEQWLRHGLAVPDAAEMLIGLGPGLTPSGDDYLGGMLVALHGLGREAQARALWRWLQPRLASRTSAISAAHLEAAASGEAHEAVHAALQGDLRGLDGVGHSSAWDALAGAAAVLRAS